VKWLYANGSYIKQPYADNLAALGFDFAQPPVRERSRKEILTIRKIGNQLCAAIRGMPRQLPVLTTRSRVSWHSRAVGNAPAIARTHDEEESFSSLYHVII
jgi:hypothetical protein